MKIKKITFKNSLTATFLLCILFFSTSVIYAEVKDDKIEAIAITDKDCAFCNLDLPMKFLKENFSMLDFKTLHHQDKEAKELIKQYAISTIPCFILPQKVNETANFEKLSEIFEEKNDKFILKKELSGIFLFLNRKEISSRIDFFLDFYDVNAASSLKNLFEFSKASNIDLNIHFILTGKSCLNYLLQEAKLALAVEKLCPKNFYDYIIWRAENIRSIFWMEGIEKLKCDLNRIIELAKSNDIQSDIDKNSQLTEELGIREGNVILAGNRRIFKVLKVTKEDLEKIFSGPR